jgi:hypothetical protein
MTSLTNQSGNNVQDGDIVAGSKTVNNNTVNYNSAKKTKLSSLFDKLQQQFDQQKKVNGVSEDLERYSVPRDTIGLEQKLIDGGRAHIIEDAAWLKQEYFKKLTRFQFFEPAQEIHAYLLGLVLQKFRYIINPMINNGNTEQEISHAISTKIIDPIMQMIQDEGCNDVMGLSSTDIDGMIYFLTGQCHIKWVKP